MAQGNAEAQLIAKAIAAFGWNNGWQLEKNQPLLESQVCSWQLLAISRIYNNTLIYSKIVPEILMLSTMPMFYKIPVT